MRISDWSSDVCSSDLLVKRHQRAQRVRSELLRQDRAARPVALEGLVRHQRLVDALGAHFVRRLPERQRLALRKQVGHQQVVLFVERAERFAEADEVAGHQPRTLVDQLVERVLAVGRSEHTSELQSLMRISYAVLCLKKKKICTHKSETRL